MEKQHFEILLENMDSKFNLLLEGFSTLDKKIDDFRGELKEDISLLDVKITALSKRVSSVETNLNARIDSVETNLNAKIDSVETNLNAKIDSVEANLSNRLDAVHSELIDHRNNSEMHKVPRKRQIRKAA